jgi:electron transport complex protein RnfB
MNAAPSSVASLVEQIDATLPQTQCTECGYAGCLPYAQAIAEGRADINQCPPGGDAGIRRLAALLQRGYKPLNPAYGQQQPRVVARIDEARCIGCTLCIQACPVDAIAGAPKHMHAVISDLCTGCKLCVAPCPVDCIDLLPVDPTGDAWNVDRADAARQRFQRRNARRARDHQERLAKLGDQASRSRNPGGARSPQEAKSAVLRAAMQRARAQRSQKS